MKKKVADTNLKRKECSHQDDNTQCPLYTKSEYVNATYCIYAMWEGTCLHPERSLK
jgi:hypothetical protein